MTIEVSNLTQLSNQELREWANKASNMIVEINKELEKYAVIQCSNCPVNDIAFRGDDLPFITWSKPSGNPLCPHCTRRFGGELPKELTISPVDEIMALLD